MKPDHTIEFRRDNYNPAIIAWESVADPEIICAQVLAIVKVLIRRISGSGEEWSEGSITWLGPFVTALGGFLEGLPNQDIENLLLAELYALGSIHEELDRFSDPAINRAIGELRTIIGNATRIVRYI